MKVNFCKVEARDQDHCTIKACPCPSCVPKPSSVSLTVALYTTFLFRLPFYIVLLVLPFLPAEFSERDDYVCCML